MWRRLLPFVLAILASPGCAHEDSAVVAAPVAAPPKQRTTGAAQPREPRDLSAVAIHMERSACYGICPSYVVDITGEGQVSYLGREFVNVRGAKKGSMDPAQVNQLMDAVDQLRLTTLVDVPPCATKETDQATVVLSIRDRGAITKLTHDLGNGCYPKELAELESMIDEAARTSQWVRCETGFCMY